MTESKSNFPPTMSITERVKAVILQLNELELPANLDDVEGMPREVLMNQLLGEVDRLERRLGIY